MKVLQAKPQIPYMLLLLEIIAIERVIKYILKAQKKSSNQPPRITWEASKKIPKRKMKSLSPKMVQDMNKWFAKWDASHLLHDVLIDSSMNDVFQFQCIIA